MAAFVDGGDAACRFCRERAGEHPDYASTIEAEIERLREELTGVRNIAAVARHDYEGGVAERNRFYTALAHELSVLRESLHVLHCGGKTPECPTREREMAMIKRIEGVLGE